jgi:hypothetical protein
MLARCAYVALAALSILASSGCCCCKGWHGRDWCDNSCGECYWSEWFNDPPACHDPCDCYGNYAGHRRRSVIQAAHHEPVPTLASPDMLEITEEMPTPAEVPRQPAMRSENEPTELQPTPAETEYAPPEGEETIETMPLDSTSEELPSGELPSLNE